MGKKKNAVNVVNIQSDAKNKLLIQKTLSQKSVILRAVNEIRARRCTHRKSTSQL